MKKALSMALTLALTTSAFAGIAGVAAADLNTQDKFKVLFDAGIFAGVNGEAAVDKTLTRAELAVILAKLNGKTQDAAASTFVDVAANHWAKGWIGAAKSAKLLEGNDKNQFLPANTVTYQDVATGLSKAKGLTAAATTTVTGTSEWAKGWVQTALDAGLILPQTDYTKTATRGDLIDATYLVYQASQKVSVAAAKATGVKTVNVVFSKAVDTAKVKLELKKGNASIATTTKFAEDKKSADLTLTDVKVGAGEYTVTLSGLEASAVDKASASFTAEDEKLDSLKFVNSSEKVAKSTHVVVELKAANQYGEAASTPASSFTAVTPDGLGASLSKNAETGLLELKMNTANYPNVQSELTIIPVTVYLNGSTLTAQKNFKVGTEPFTTTIKLGAVKYPAGKTALNAKNDEASISVTRHDQYGDVIPGVLYPLTGNTYVTPYAPEIEAKVNQTDKYTVNIKMLSGVEKSGEYTVTVYVGSAQATAKLDIKSAKVATKVEFGDLPGTVAQGDGTVYVPLVLYDADGNKLSADDIVANADRLSISVSGLEDNSKGNGWTIDTSVDHKGQLKLNKVLANTQVLFLTAGINTANVQSNVQARIPVSPARVPASIKLDTDAAPKGINGAVAKHKWIVQDQYGAKFEAVPANFNVQVSKSGDAAANAGVATGNVAFKAFNDGFDFTATALGDATVTATVYEVKSGVSSVVATVSKTFTTLNAATTDLTYSIEEVPAVYAAIDNAITKDLDYPNSNANYNSVLAKQIKLAAKDASGDKVALPAGQILDALSQNSNVAVVVKNAGEAKILGNKAGTTAVSVVYKTTKGQADAVVNVTVKSDAVTVDKITADSTKSVSVTANVYDAMNLKIVDNYGGEYTGGNIGRYDAVLGTYYVISDIKVDKGTATATVNRQTGAITFTKTDASAKVTGYTVKATASNGKNVTTVVTVTQ